MWAFALRYRAAHLNEMVIPWRVRGPLRPDVLGEALTDLTRQHPTLRSRLSYQHGQLLQLVMPVEPVTVRVASAEGETPDARLRAAMAEITGGAREHVDILSGPTLIARLLPLGPDDHLLALHVHHAMCDGWSIGIMLRDLVALYQARLAGTVCELPLLPEQYADVARREAETYASGGFAEEIGYWQEKLANLPPPLALPAIGARKGNRDWRSAEMFVKQPAAFMHGMREVTRQQRVSLFALFVAALSVVLRHRSGRQDLLIGVPTLNRWTNESMQFVGYATSMLPLRVRPESGLAFNALCKQVNGSVREMLAYGRVPLEVLLRETPLAPLGNNVFPIWCQYLEGRAVLAESSAGLSFEPLPTERNSLLAELDVDLAGFDDAWRCDMAYRQSLFTAPMVSQLMADLVATLERVQQDATQPLDDLVLRLDSPAASSRAS